MPEQPKVIAEFKECPNCRPSFLIRLLLKLFRKPYHLETITQRATKDLKAAGRVPKEAFTSLSKQVVPLTDPRVALSVETLLVHYDVCANCGMTYCTRAEVGTGVVNKVMSQQGAKTPFNPS